ncbi:RNA methyltransferase [Wenyingzhuangia fucanilytica]|uniref:RNA methyltransferase n=1 Tax=Wenyingzhuangia fucanilytica TaxID=1790137 RepID=A0A1B1Y595_9FLAO|nr:TfoX/Sxy family protein [Wenyingzhuangia fucanilytica]ANW95908.1 RNA methyltransferase [Wenyingzhuangia fucanilytica]
MAYDTYLEERITRVLKGKNIVFNAKKMMGGLCYMVDDKMCFGIVKEQFMARIGTDFYPFALEMNHVNEMNFTGRAMKGYVFIDADGLDTEEQLAFWIQKCLDFNPLAKSSKKKRS